MSRSTRDVSGVAEMYDRIADLAAQIERDELAIKDSLVDALEDGRGEFALKILREWRTTSPRDVVSKYLEAGDGNSE